MPRGDKTGPNGQGMMTGRKMGYCAGFNVPGFMNGAGFGGGFGGGFGRGCGRGRRFWGVNTVNFQQMPVQQNEKEMLKMESESLKARLEELTKRLEELEKK